MQTVITNFDYPRTVQFRLGDLVRQLSIPEFGIALGLYMDEFMDDNDLDTLHCHIHYSPSTCWRDLIPTLATYDPSRSKAPAHPPSLSYLHTILAHTLTGRRESTSVVTSHDAYFLWSNGERARHRPYLLYCLHHLPPDGAAQERGHLYRALCDSISALRVPQYSSQSPYLTLIGQMSSHGILSMLSMRMIEKRHGTYPPQYHLAQSTDEEDLEDIPDDVPPHHKDPPTQPPPPSRPVHSAASYADISERLTRLEQQCFQHFDNIDATLQ
ncbi:hypothetical protein PVK06_020495 [Gossypium arboreum]|uniref:Uncharacterized protein n=1 Tax=Gossypium arboreum TaxID=29729 RepID=A0ABR0PMH8_GOSAR|nr:hypothetical protein PVK06_020495 [Gossypium arboreum]